MTLFVRTAVLLFGLSLPLQVFADAAPASVAAVSTSAQSISLLASPQSPAMLIGSVSIDNGSIFDIENPEEDKLLFRLANRAHITTRPSVIEQQLLFKAGDLLSAQELEETERILRSNRYIQDARIETTTDPDGAIAVNVHTTDVWTLIPKVSFSRSGGENNSGVGIKEMNLMGTGMAVEVAYKSDVDRNSSVLKFSDSHLGNSWYRLEAQYANNSDGYTYLLNLGKPFYSLGSTSAQGFAIFSNEQIDSLYDRGEVVAQYRRHAESYELFKGWSAGLRHGWVRRYTTGVAYDKRLFSTVEESDAPPNLLPENRLFAYPFVAIELVQDHFEKSTNRDQINRTEDRFLGTRFGARLGIARSAFGSDRDAWLINVGTQRGFGDSDGSSLILASNLETRVEGDGLRNLSVDMSARFFRRQSAKRLFYAGLTATFGRNLDVDNQLLLGGDNGLRGYPLRYQTGDKAFLLTVEQRFFTDWYPFRLFNVGGALFFDAGRAWGDSVVSSRQNELLRDVGFGLRIGNSRSGLGRMIHVDIAFPLDGDQEMKSVQFLVSTKKSF